jgi:hypothetical protein
MLRSFFTRRVRTTRICSILFVYLVCMSCSFVTRAAGTQTAQRCGASQDQPAARVFADSDGLGWHEYQNIKNVPELQLNGGSAALLWLGSDGNLLVGVQEPGEDFTAYTDYCFDRTGHLLQLRYELRTAWGWDYREEGPFSNGKLKREISEFFSPETEQPIKKPEQADDVPDALKPHIYLKKSQLPFFKLLSK